MSEPRQSGQFYDQYWERDFSPPYLDALFPAFEYLGIQPEAKILDIGCGNGVLGEFLIRRYGCQMYGTEVSPVAGKAAAARGYTMEAVGPEQLTAYQRPFPDIQFDIVVMSAILEHVFDPAKLLAMAFSALKDGGYVVILTPNITWFLNRILFLLDIWEHPLLGGTPGHIRYLNRHMLRELLTDAGFRNLDWSYSSMAALPPNQDLFVRNHRVPFIRYLVNKRTRRRPSMWAENFVVLGRKPISDGDIKQWANLKSPHRIEGLKVLHIAATRNGATWMCNIVRELRARGYDAYAMISPGKGDLAPKLEQAGVPYFTGDLDIFDTIDFFHIANKLFKLARFLRKHRFDIVHYHLFNSVILGRVAAYITDVPIRYSMITGPYYLEAQAPREIDRKTLWMDTKIIASCEFTRQLYCKMGVSTQKLERIFYGADPLEFDPAAADQKKLRREFVISAKDPIVSMVSFFYKRFPANAWTPPHLHGRSVKGHETFLEAALLVLKQNPRAKFFLVGNGWEAAGVHYEQEMKELAKQMGLDSAVIFTGRRQDIPDVLASSDVTVQCSRSENLGGTIEALLMARPIVATAVGGMVDSVHHEETGLLVPMDDAPRLADAILRLIDDPTWAHQLGQKGRRLMLRDFTLTRTVDDIDQLYQDGARRIFKGKRITLPNISRYRIYLSVIHMAFLPFRWVLYVLWQNFFSLIPRFLRRFARLLRHFFIDPKKYLRSFMWALADLMPVFVPFAAIVFFISAFWKVTLLIIAMLFFIIVRMLYVGPTMILIRLLTKRIYDLLGVVIIGMATLPLCLGVLLTIRRDSSTPILSGKLRAGRFGEVFTMFAFQTLLFSPGCAASAASGTIGRGFTAFFGRIVQRLRLHRLPLLLNVIRGEMCLVGPRSVSPEEADHYSADQWHRLDVKPGIVGWATIHGGSHVSTAEEIKLDLWYVAHWSFWVDLYILFRSFLYLLKK
jgi:lipopolysaccharide/colanic/teichoic acid biosynthesis glycosyltransferase/glycosyltransferase involved in cell wall biosynthesis